MPNPAIIPCEGTVLAYATASAGTYTPFGEEVTSIQPPAPKQEPVPTAGLTSTFASSRPSKQIKADAASFKFFADPNFAAHKTIHDAATNGITYWWQITYPDGLATHTKELGPGYVSSLKETGVEVNKNKEWEVEITPTALWALSQGSST